VIRRILAPEAKPRVAGYRYLRALVRFDAVRGGEFVFTFGAGDRFLYHDLGENWVYWAGMVVGDPDDPDPHEGHKAHLSGRFREFPSPIPALIDATDEGAIFRFDIRDVEPKHRWVHGRVALMGDAAHAMTPNLGRGAGEAISDALALARTLADAGGVEGNVAGALLAYERERREKTAEVQRRSWRMGRVASWSNPVACALRAQVVKRIVARGMRRGTDADFAELAAAASEQPASVNVP
jgi:2-polyprenyl-6-methoxyphenol hydroxylase-like FAD-dependent oxidoreductase